MEVPEAPRPILGTAHSLIANDGEELRRAPALRAFRITPTTIFNAEYARFVDAPGYATGAERFGWSFFCWSDVPESFPTSQAIAGLECWRRIDGATWRDVNSPGTANRSPNSSPRLGISATQTL